MEPDALLSATEWAVMTYGSVYLGDQRRTERAVTLASALARNPMASLPAQMGSHAATKAAYRFLQTPQIRYEQLMRPHLEQTRERMRQHAGRVLLIQDTTEVDFHGHPKTKGLSQVGKKAHHQGYLLQSVLAVDASTREVLGLAAQEPFLRQAVPEGETTSQRKKHTQKESQVWPRQAERIGRAPEGAEYTHVGDRWLDLFAFLRACLAQRCSFLVRAKHDRRVDLLVDQAEAAVPSAARRHGKQRAATQEPVQHLFDVVQSWPERDRQSLQLDGNQKRDGRVATLCISWGTLRLWEPDAEGGKGERPMVVTVVRTWEPEPPEGVAALEWVLITNVEVHSREQAWERVEWYRMRWIVEDYHQCLKTGCLIEKRQLQDFEGLRRMLGLLAPLAVRLLQLRACVCQEPERAAKELLPLTLVKVVAHLAKVAPDQLTMRRCWHRIAQAGGYLGRKGDGEPGWKTLWKGWIYVQTLLEGIALAPQLLLE